MIRFEKSFFGIGITFDLGCETRAGHKHPIFEVTEAGCGLSQTVRLATALDIFREGVMQWGVGSLSDVHQN